MTALLLVLAGFAAGVVVSQLALVTLLLIGRRMLRRRRRPRTAAPETPDDATGITAGELGLVDDR